MDRSMSQSLSTLNHGSEFNKKMFYEGNYPLKWALF